MKIQILLLLIAGFNAFALEYGQLYLATPVEVKSQSVTISYQNELDNKLNDISGVGLSYGHRFNSYIEVYASYYRYSQAQNDFSKTLNSNVNVISAAPKDRKSISLNFIPLIGQINLLSYKTAQIELAIGASFGMYSYSNQRDLLINDEKFYDLNFTTTVHFTDNYFAALKLSRITRSENAKNDTNLNSLDVNLGVRF